MKIKYYCSPCNGSGNVLTNDPYMPPTITDCSCCGGLGYTTTDIIGTEFDDIHAELTSLRTDLTTALTAIYNKVKNL